MKKLFTISLLAIFALTRIAFAQNEIIQHLKQNNLFGSALFETISQDGCVVTDVSLHSGHGIQQVNGGGKPINSQFTSIIVSVADYCQGVYLYYASSGVWEGDGATVADNLTSANMDVTIPLTDLISGTTSDAHIVINWNSTTGMITHQFSNTHINLKGLHESLNNNGIYRLANASGSLSIGGAPNIIPDPAYFSYIIRGGIDDIINFNLGGHRLANPEVNQVVAVNAGISLYPNPATDMLHVGLSNATQYSIYNMLGALVSQHNVEGKTSEDIDLGSFAPGVYSMRLQTDQGEVVKKFVKE